MENIEKRTVGGLVAEDYRLASVFKKYEIDFCCNGNRSVEEACLQNNLSLQQVTSDLLALMALPGREIQGPVSYASWPPDLLADYIEKKHHRYVAEQTPVLQAYLEKLCRVHGDNHPELFEIKSLFGECAAELAIHMKKEELMLFPAIKKTVRLQQQGLKISNDAIGRVRDIAGTMMEEHDGEGERFRRINGASNHYEAPADGCNTYRLVYGLLKEFEDDLHLHIHLENNILFPRSIELEKQLSA